jgi:hypothetical protein
MIRPIVLAGAAALAAAPPPNGFDVVHCELDVLLRDRDRAVAATLHATGPLPKPWRLDLVPEMKVVAAESGGAAVPFSTSGSTLTLDLGAVPLKGVEVVVTVRCEGAPSERFSQSHGGYVRTVVGPEVTYVRSQVAWYPCAADDQALYDITVDAPAAHQVRSAGEFEPPVADGERATWTFHSRSPIERAGLAAEPSRLFTSESFDALVRPEHEKAADGLLALARKALEFQHATSARSRGRASRSSRCRGSSAPAAGTPSTATSCSVRRRPRTAPTRPGSGPFSRTKPPTSGGAWTAASATSRARGRRVPRPFERAA